VTSDPGTAKIIEARDLVLSFGETPALRGASMGVRQGEIVAVMAWNSYSYGQPQSSVMTSIGFGT